MALYDEAVVDAQKLREVAENAAKQEILEAITPRIRKMINARILSEREADPELEDIGASDEDLEPQDTQPVDSDMSAEAAPDEDDDIEMSDDLDQIDTMDFSGPQAVTSSGSGVVINNTGDIHIKANESIFRKESKRVAIVEKLENVLSRISSLDQRLLNAEKMGLTKKEVLMVSNTYRKLVSEAITLNSELSSCGGGSQRLERKLVSTLKEMKTMSRRTKKNIFDFLFEGEDNALSARRNRSRFLYEADEGDKDEGDKDDDAGGDDAGGDVDLDKIKDLVGQLQDAIGGGEEEEGAEGGDLGLGGEEEGGEKKEESMDEGDNLDEMYTEDDDLDETYTEDDDLDEMYTEDDDMGEVNMPETYTEDDDLDEMYTEDDDMGEGNVYEIEESALRRELGKMKRLRESRTRRARLVRENAATDKASHFGGGEVLGDVFYDIDEDKLINVLADELGSVKTKPKASGSSAKNESTAARKAMREAAVYKQAAQKLQSQLVEMNLFNAKLLYANKLMQNKNLTVKQQRAIVEALDNAKTLREAKLLYKSLSESLARRGQASGNLSEGATRTVLGSSSRSTRSAQPAKSGVEVDRWATLAGIKGESK